MGEMDNDLLQFFYNGKPIRQGDFGCGTITKPSPISAERLAQVKTEMDVMDEKYKPIADKLVEEIYKSSQEPIIPLGEEIAQQLNTSFEDLHKFMSTFPPTFTHLTRRKARKYYKPKFTL